MEKYYTHKIAGVIISICKTVQMKAYPEKVLETLLPDNTSLNSMSKKEEQEWIRLNNERMTKICRFMNENNL